MDCKYRLLFSSSAKRGMPGPKGASPDLIAAIVAMKSRNPKFGCVRIAQQMVLVIMDLFTRRSVGFGVECSYIDGVALCRMFNHAIAGQPLPKGVSTDHDPLFRFHRWLANLRVLGIEEVKSIPFVPVSHPFAEDSYGWRQHCGGLFQIPIAA